MIVKKLWFSVFCFLIHSIAADDNSNSKTNALKMMPKNSHLNFVDNVLWTCTVQKLLAIEIQLSKDQEPSDDEFKKFLNQVLQLWRTLAIKVYNDFDGYIAVYNEIKNKEPKDNRMALTNLVSKLITSGPADGITNGLSRLYASSVDNQFDTKMLTYESSCTNILKVFTPDNLVTWINSALDGIKEIDYNNSSLKLTQYRMISNVITPSGINETTQIEDTTDEEKNVFETHVCQLFSQYLKDTVRVYKDFYTAVQKIDVSDILDDDEKTSYMAGVVQEFTEIMYLVNSFKSLPVDCLTDATLNDVAGEVWRINDQVKAYFVNFLSDFGNDETNEQKQIIEENGIVKFFLRGKIAESKEYLEETRNKLPKTYPEDSRKVNYDTYYIDDKAFAYETLENGVQNYPTLFTDEIKKIICLRSVITFYTASLMESKFKSTQVTQYSDDKNVLKCVVPDYLS